MKLMGSLILFFCTGLAMGGEIVISQNTLRGISVEQDQMLRRILSEHDTRSATERYAERIGIATTDFAFALLEYSEKERELGHVKNAKRAIGFAVDVPGTNIVSRLRELAVAKTSGDMRGDYFRAYVWKTPEESLPLARDLWPEMKPEEKCALVDMLKTMKYDGHAKSLDLWDEYLREMLGNETDELVAKGIREYIAIAMQNQDTVAHVGPAAKAGGNVP